MTQQAVLSPTLERRPSDRAAQVAVSACVVAAMAALYVWSGNALFESLVTADLDVRSLNLLGALFSTLFLGVTVAVRSRNRRRLALGLGICTLHLAAASVIGFVIGPDFDTSRLAQLSWLVWIADDAANLLVVAAWGVARRHGSWWWTGLVPAAGIELLQGDLLRVLLDLLPEDRWDPAFYVVPLAVPILGALCCWVVDLVTTRPRPAQARGRLEP